LLAAVLHQWVAASERAEEGREAREVTWFEVDLSSSKLSSLLLSPLSPCSPAATAAVLSMI
jgi:hypothetical protein